MGVPKTTLYKYCMEHSEARHLLEEYDISLNEKSIHEIGANTSVKVHWYCKKHEYRWEETVSNRTNRPNTPCCTGRAATSTRNLASMFPEILRDFDYENNNEINPETLLPYSHIRINWKCHKCGYKWNTKCGDRVRKLTSCPNCSSRQTSKAEKLLIDYFKELFPETKKTKIEGVEFDVVIPELKIAIEYDGYPWHLEKYDNHLRKLCLAKENDLTLINIAEYKATKEIREDVEKQYSQEHKVIYYEVNSTYDISNLLDIVIDYFRENGVKLTKPDREKVISILEQAQMRQIPDSIWNSKDIPWIRNWISPEDIALAQCIKAGSAENIRITCPNCERQWETRAHWIKKQFRGCTKRSGGCGFQGLMGDQLAKSSETFKKCNNSRREYLHNYHLTHTDNESI